MGVRGVLGHRPGRKEKRKEAIGRWSHLFDDALDLLRRPEGEALQDVGAKGAARRLELGFGPVDAGQAALGVAAVGVFVIVDHHAGVQEAAADCPEEGGESAGLEGVLVVSMFCAL